MIILDPIIISFHTGRINILISKNQNEIPIISRERQLLKVKKSLNHLKAFNSRLVPQN